MFQFINYKNSVVIKDFLNKKIPSYKKVFRYNFHKNNNDNQQFMLIFQKKNYYYPPKKFLDSKKIYILIKGKLRIFTFDSKGRITKKYLLDKNNNVCILNKNVYHLDTPNSNEAVHCEITFHSFLKRKIKFMNKNLHEKIKKKIKI